MLQSVTQKSWAFGRHSTTGGLTRLKKTKTLLVAIVLLLRMQTVGSPISQDGVHLIVELKESCLLGGVQNGKWVNAERLAKRVKAGQKLSLFQATGAASEISITKLAEHDCPSETAVETSAKAELGVAISSPTWNVIPRTPRAIDSKDSTYLKVISDILRASGIRSPEVNISEGYKIDLDGDGKDEVVIIASRFANGVSELTGVSHAPASGDYALVLVRKIINEKVQNIFVVKDIRKNENEGPLTRGYHISAIADLNGDGVMELVLYSAYHEGSSSDVIQIKGTKPVAVLSCACEH
jgi:hypothetical protein